jgi:hypothetical protein
MLCTLHLLVAAFTVNAFAPTPATVRRRPLYGEAPPKRLRTADLDENGRCQAAGIIVKASPGKGFGAFAARAFEADATVADYVGEQLTQEEKDVRYLKSKMTWKDRLRRKARQAKGITVTGDYLFRVDGDDLYVDAEDPAFANWCRFINHSSDANLRVKSLAYSGYTQGPRVWFVATRDIKEGEELCFDYGDDYWFESDKPVA